MRPPFFNCFRSSGGMSSEAAETTIEQVAQHYAHQRARNTATGQDKAQQPAE